MKKSLYLFSMLVLVMTSCSVDQAEFEDLACVMFTHQLKVAESYLEDQENVDLLSPNIKTDYFKLDESEKVKFLLFWLAWNKLESIDGERAHLLMMMFGCKMENGNYNQEIAENRYNPIQKLGRKKRENFVKSLDLSETNIEEKLLLVARLLVAR